MPFWFGMINDFIYFKIATTLTSQENKKINTTNILAFVVLTFLMSLLSMIHLSEIMPSWLRYTFTILMQLFRFLLVVIFCITIKKSSAKNSILAAFFAESTVFSTRVLSGGFYMFIISFNVDINPNMLIIPLNLLVMLFSIVGRKQLLTIFESIQRSIIMRATIIMIMILFYAGSLFIMPLMGAISPDNETVMEMTILTLMVVVLSLMLSLVIGAIKTTAKKEVMQKEAESQVLKFYADEMERQYANIRSFKHDYANVMLTFKQLIDHDDMVGIKKFYYKNMDSLVVKQVADSAVKDIARLKIPEVKSLILSKIQLASIPIFYESKKDIDTIPIDMIDFLRLVGIVMDNAIEEVDTLGVGEVWVGFDVNEYSVVFICKNDCRPDTPAVHELKADGFSTKGNGRGIGLNNLDKLVEKYENAFLETMIENGQFVQRLSMEL